MVTENTVRTLREVLKKYLGTRYQCHPVETIPTERFRFVEVQFCPRQVPFKPLRIQLLLPRGVP